MYLSNTIKAILEDPYVNAVFELSPEEIYLVGGFIRDSIINQKSLDRDFILKDNINEIVQKISRLFDGTIVKLKETIRVALKNGITLDFTEYSDSIEEDLSRRDFTFNAIALSASGRLIDPYNGVDDLKKGIIRMIRAENLLNDPVRILRAYRFVSELDGFIEEQTRQSVINYKDKIRYEATERITLEFLKLLEGRNPEKALKMACEDNLLNIIFLFKNKELDKLVKRISKLSENLEEAPNLISPLKGIPLKGLLLLEILMEESEGRSLLKLPKRIIKRIKDFLRGQKSGCLENVSEEASFDCLELYGEAVFDAIIINGKVKLWQQAERYIKISESPLLRGEDLLSLGIKEGPEMGTLLRLLRKAAYEGQISTREEAIRFIQNIKKLS